MKEPAPIVLVGGRSTRFGRDKLREPVAGRWLVDVAIAALRGATGADVTLVGPCDRDVAVRGDAHLDDAHAGVGPAGGVLTALERLGDVVVLSGDLPRVGAAAVRALLDAGRAAPDASIVRATGEPLIAIYRTAIAPVITARLAGGRRSLLDLAPPPQLCEVEIGGDLRDADAPHALAIGSFEEIDPDVLDLVPIAARRALDHAGLHLSLEGWRTLPLDRRRALVTLGAAPTIDLDEVGAIARGAEIAPRAIERARELGRDVPAEVPLGGERARVERAWPMLSPLERFAIVHAARSAQRRGDPARLARALASILGGD